MNLSNACPIVDRQVDETVVRLISLLVCLIAVIGCFAFLPWVAVALALDFFVRAFTSLPISYLALTAKSIAKMLHLQSKPINGGPKIFAARMGFVFTVVIAILGFMHLSTAAVVLAAALAFFAALEAIFSFCIGCHIYSILQKCKA